MVKKFENIDEIKKFKTIIFWYRRTWKYYIKDLADIETTDNSDEIYAKVNGNDGAIFTFQKQSTASTADICKKIETTMEKLGGWNENLRFTTLMNQGIYIDMIINSALDNLFYGRNTQL